MATMANSGAGVCLASYKYIFRPDLFSGMVAFITGGGSGIGFTIAEVLMRHQCDTIIASRNLARVTASASELTRVTGRQCLPIQMDVRKPEEVKSAVEQAMKKFKKIDILVNNAAGNFLCPAAGLSFNAFKTVMEIDTMGTFNVSKVVYEQSMRDRGGVIVNISATLAYRGQAFQTHSGSAKAAVDAMTRHLAVEWGADNVRVVGIAPGPILDTEGARRLGPAEGLDGLVQSLPLRRAGRREDVANGVLFLASDAASFITGETLVADGGAWFTMPNVMTAPTQSSKL